MTPKPQPAQQIHQLYDKFLKDMAEHHSAELLGLAFPEDQFKVLSAQLDKELILRSRQVDTVMLVRTKRGRQIFHLEFKAEYNRRELRKIFGYAGALTLKYRLDVTTILYLVKPPSKRAGDLGLYQAMPFGVPTNQFGFRVVRLWELLDAILAGDKRLTALVPLLLELVTKPDIAYLHRQRELIRLEEDPVRRAELYYYATAFARRHFSDNFLKEFFKEDQKMYEYWSSVPIFGDLLEDEVQKRVQEQVQKRVQEQVQKQVQKQVQEQVQQTEQKALQASIMTVLASRFGVENGRVARLVHSIDNAKKLQTVFQRALKANDLNAVIGMLQKAKLPARRKTAKV